jgi:putative addiction module component (TIGR02574 family)
LSGWGNRATVIHNERLAAQTENLSASEKAELLEAVWVSLEADALSLTDAQRAELDQRIERHEQKIPPMSSMGASQGEPVQKALTLAVVWIAEANEDLLEARAWYGQHSS